MCKEVRKRISEIIEEHKRLVSLFESDGLDSILSAADAITERLLAGGCVYICGNGGSAADAQHISAELVGKYEKQRKGFAAVALTTDSSVLTSLSNDYGYENIFYKQVESLVNSGDILWAISTSGESENIIKACALAKSKGALLLAFTGTAGSRLEEMADVCFCARSENTARAQEIHQLGYHIICGIVEENLSD